MRGLLYATMHLGFIKVKKIYLIILYERMTRSPNYFQKDILATIKRNVYQERGEHAGVLPAFQGLFPTQTISLKQTELLTS